MVIDLLLLDVLQVLPRCRLSIGLLLLVKLSCHPLGDQMPWALLELSLLFMLFQFLELLLPLFLRKSHRLQQLLTYQRCPWVFQLVLSCLRLVLHWVTILVVAMVPQLGPNCWLQEASSRQNQVAKSPSHYQNCVNFANRPTFAFTAVTATHHIHCVDHLPRLIHQSWIVIISHISSTYCLGSFVEGEAARTFRQDLLVIVSFRMRGVLHLFLVNCFCIECCCSTLNLASFLRCIQNYQRVFWQRLDFLSQFAHFLFPLQKY